MPNFNLSISPPQLELLIKPGSSFIQAYSITNDSDFPVYLSTSIENWEPNGPNGSVTYNRLPPDPNIKFSLANSDLALGQSFLLLPKETKQIVLKINPLKTATTSDFYYTFFISQDLSNSMAIGTNQSQTNAKVGSHILLSLSYTDKIKYQSKIIDFTALPNLKDSFLTPISFSAKIKNTTDHFFKPSGKILITKNNSIIKELTILPQNVLAKNQRQITCQTENTTSTNCNLTPPFWPGKYTATIHLSNENSASSSASINFYVFPLSPIIFILFIILIIFLTIKFKPRFFQRI